MIPFFIKINILWYCYRSRMLSELLWLSMINDIKLSSFYPLGFFSPRRHAIKDIFHWCNIWQLQRAESRIRIWWSYLNHHSFPPTLSILSLSVMGRVGKRIIGILNSVHKTHEWNNGSPFIILKQYMFSHWQSILLYMYILYIKSDSDLSLVTGPCTL